MPSRRVPVIFVLIFALGCGSSSGSGGVDSKGGSDAGGNSTSIGESRGGAESSSDNSGGGKVLGVGGGGVGGGIGGGASTTSQGGTSLAGLGGSTPSGSGGGNIVVGGAGASGGGTCPTWPRSKLLPTVGPQFYGPNPGPCTSTTLEQTGASTTTTYAYADGLLISAVYPSSSRKYSYDAGVLASYTTTSTTESSTVKVSWTSDAAVTTASSGMVIRYVLDGSGYPQEVWAAPSDTGPSTRVIRFEYADCRLVQKLSLLITGEVDPRNSSVLEYDEVGRIVAQRDGWGTVISYDYGCW